MALDLYGNEMPVRGPHGKMLIKGKVINPMVYGMGPGPEGKKCKHCEHCYAKQFSGRYYKCDLRGNTNGPATDIKVNWPACAKFEEKKNGTGN